MPSILPPSSHVAAPQAQSAQSQRGKGADFAAVLGQVGEPVLRTVRQTFYAQLFGPRQGAHLIAQGYIPTDGANSAYREKFSAFAARFEPLAEREGIATKPQIALALAPDGSISAPGHPDAQQIFDLFAQDSGLADSYRDLVTTAGEVRAAEEGTAFAAAYEQDQPGAITRFSHLFGEGQPQYRYRLGAGGSSAAYAWPDGRVTPWAPPR